MSNHVDSTAWGKGGRSVHAEIYVAGILAYKTFDFYRESGLKHSGRVSRMILRLLEGGQRNANHLPHPLLAYSFSGPSLLL